ncbi:MAG TPA: sialidase family protein, partial [Candidatus Sulfopaludibacter sp.]|nr:sialidase family protein [Candidatus Sulfopaludibacter sp.]
VALGVNVAANQTSILVSRSADGGFTWSYPILIDRDNSGGDDKESLATDPNDARYVYVVWDRTSANPIPAWFSRSTDAGVTYEPARIIYNPGAGGHATANQIVVLPDGTLVDVLVLSDGSQSNIAAIRSSDHGATWSTPIIVAADETVGTVDPKTQKGIRSGAGIPSAAVDPASGAIYLVWSDARFSGGLRDGIALSKSLDGGVTWWAPAQVNQALNVQAFTPAVAAGPSGVAVTYYDFRQDTNDPGTLLTSYWRVVSTDGGTTWRETPVAGPFDLLSGPRVTGGVPFLGDYQSLAALGNGFLAFFVVANTGNTSNPSSVLADSSERPIDPRSNNLRTEVNLHPRPYNPLDKPPPKRRGNLLH